MNNLTASTHLDSDSAPKFIKEIGHRVTLENPELSVSGFLVVDADTTERLNTWTAWALIELQEEGFKMPPLECLLTGPGIPPDNLIY